MSGLRETKVKGNGECNFGSIVGKVYGVVKGCAREGVAFLLGTRVLERIVEYREMSARFMGGKFKF